MKTVLSACVALWLVAMTTAEDIPKCHGVTDEQMTKIKSMVVKENIHDKLVGNYSLVYGPKTVLDNDSASCVEFMYQRVDDDEIGFTMITDGKWFMGHNERNGALNKVANGIYVMSQPVTGKMRAVKYFFYAKDKVLARFACWTEAPPSEDSQHAKLPYVTDILSAERPLSEATTKDVDEIKATITAQPEVFGEIGYYSRLC